MNNESEQDSLLFQINPGPLTSCEQLTSIPVNKAEGPLCVY